MPPHQEKAHSHFVPGALQCPLSVPALCRSFWILLGVLPPAQTELVSLFEQVSNGRAYGVCLGVGGFLLQVESEVLGAAGQQAVWTVGPVTRAEQPLTGQCQVLVPVWRVV